MPITPATARAAHSGATLYDDEVTGLQLRCRPKGKVWYLYYRTRDGKERRPRLGAFPEMTLTAAREVARSLKADVAAGRDVAGDWRARRTAPTVADLCDRYLEWARHRKRESSVYEDERMLRRYVRPGLGRERVADVTLEKVEAFLTDVENRRWAGTTNRRADRDTWRGKRRSPGARNRVRALLGKMFSLACTRLTGADGKPWCALHPVKGTELAALPGRRRLVSPAELAAVAREIRAVSPRAPRSAAGLWLLLLTGARVGEVAGLRRDEWHGDRLVLSEHKTVRAIGEKTIPLPPAAVALLEQLDSAERFGPTDVMIAADLSDTWAVVREKAGCPDLQMRDLRKAFASYALASNISLDQLGDLYGHTSTQTTRGYAWLLQDDRQRVAAQVAETILAVASKPDPAG